jgi:hypothetical protein
MKASSSNRYNRWYNRYNRLNNPNTKLSQKQPTTKLFVSVATDPLSIVIDHLEKNCVVSLTTSVATDHYIRYNGINHSRSKVVQK